ncbi:MAG: twin-arginine translocase TatA/TatE family subunit [Deltaproteobacteria bacterium]|nr:twin-arginine translocase TatA/TatE family subunit [Deltaproteobacteria bacterium]
MGNLGMTEWLVIGCIAVLLFGSKKLPELGRGIARGIQELKKGLKEGEESPKSEESLKADKSQEL